MYVIYTHTCNIYTYMYAYIHLYVCIYTHICMHIYTYMYAYIHIYTYIYDYEIIPSFCNSSTISSLEHNIHFTVWVVTLLVVTAGSTIDNLSLACGNKTKNTRKLKEKTRGN